MLDPVALKIITPFLNKIILKMKNYNFSPNTITITGFIFGICGALLITQQYYISALFVILINRLFDGLDGAFARTTNQTSSAGGFLDICLDFIFYSAIPFCFIFVDPIRNSLAAAFLIFSFIAAGSSFLAFAASANKQQLKSNIYPNKAFYYLEGLTEGSETIFFFICFCLFPTHFSTLAYIFGSLCWFTAISRIWFGFKLLS